GLADLPENIVGRIDGVADRALVEELKAVSNFLRRSLNARSTNDSRRETWAEFRFLNGHSKPGVAFSRGQFGFDRLEWQGVDCGPLARPAPGILRGRAG